MVEYIGIANDPLAQSVEHLTFNQGVRSSSLRWVTKKALETFVSEAFLIFISRPNSLQLRKELMCVRCGRETHSENFAHAWVLSLRWVTKKPWKLFSVVLNGEFADTKNRQWIVFSADLCYNGANEKPLSLGEVAAKPTERVRLWNETPSHPLRGSSPKGRAFGCVQP